MFHQPVQVGDVCFQRPYTYRLTVIILHRCLTDHLSLGRLCYFTQIAMLRDLHNGFRRLRNRAFILQGKMLRSQHHFILYSGSPGQNNHPVNGMLQLAYASGPAVIQQMAMHAGA